MRIISWNMGCAPRQSTYRRTHANAWAYLLGELRPDICFVQEALLFSRAPEEYGRIFWSGERSSDSASAVLVRSDIAAEEFSFSCEGSYVAGASVALGGIPTTFLSIHVGPPNYRKNLRALAAKLSATVSGTPFVVGGDLNAARHVDKVYGGRWYTRYFDELIAGGFHDCHWALNGREQQSFWGRQARNPYQCDHFFVDPGAADLVAECTVVDNPSVRSLSDHGPLRLVLSARKTGAG
jgi:exonuclease III